MGFLFYEKSILIVNISSFILIFVSKKPLKRNSLKTTITWLVMGLLVISNIVLAMLYFSSGDEEPGVASTENVEQISEDVAPAEENVAQSEETVEVLPASENRTIYEAKASKFSLNIPSEYQVVVDRDGGSGGLHSTMIKIGRKNADEHGSVSLAADDYVKIEAYPSDVNGNRDEFVTNDTALQGNSADESSTNIDGTQARRFTLNGVGKTIKYYFERGGVTYFIEAWDISSGDTNIMLDDVIGGFRFK